MTRVLSAFVLLCAAFAIGCDSKSGHEALADEMVGTMREMVQVVKGIKDEQSAKDARPKMQALRKRADEQKARGEKLGPASAETERRMKEKHGKELEQLAADLNVELMRIAQDPKIAPHMREAMQGL